MNHFLCLLVALLIAALSGLVYAEPTSAPVGKYDDAIADTVADFSGAQGTNGWRYGTRDAAADHDTSQFTPLQTFQDHAWQQAGSDVMITRDRATASTGLATVRRWHADRAGSIRLVGRLQNVGKTSASCIVCSGDRIAWQRDLTTDDTIPHDFDILICDLEKGADVDLVTSSGSVAWQLQILSEPCSGWRPDAPIGPVFSDEQKQQQRAAGTQILQQITRASVTHQRMFTIPPGDYRFTGDEKRAPHLRGLQNIAIDAAGVTFWSESPLVHGITFDECTNVSITGLTMDCDPMPFFQGRITAIDRGSKTVTAEIMAGYEPQENSGKRTVAYYRPDGSFILNPIIPCTWEKDPASNIVKVHADSPDVSVGDFITCVIRTGQQLRCIHCAGMSFANINLFAGGGMAVYESRGGGGSVYRNVHVTRRPFTNRLHAFGADGFHFSGLGKGPIVDRCEAAYLGDDVMNLHGQLGLVIKRISDNEYVLFSGSDAAFLVGQHLSFWGFVDAEPLGSCTIIRVRPEPADHYDVTFDHPVKLPEQTLIDTHRQDSPGYVVKNCWFHDDGQRFLLNGAPNGIIENNTFQNIDGWIAIQEESWDGWTEGAFPNNTIFRNNRLIKTEFGLQITIEPAGGDYIRRTTPIQNVKLLDNYFEQVGKKGSSVIAKQIDGLTISGNIFDHPIWSPDWHGFDFVDTGFGDVGDSPIFLAAVMHANIDHNLIYDPLGRTDQRQVRLGPLTRAVTVDGQPQPDCFADSISSWRPNSVQGRGGWQYGAIPALAAGTKSYAPSQFVQLQRYDNGWKPPHDTYPFVTMMGLHPKTDAAAVRRWISTYAGTLNVEGVVKCPGQNGNGTMAYIFVDGKLAWQQDTLDRQPHPIHATLHNIHVGSAIDFVVDAKGDMDSDYTTYYCKLMTLPANSKRTQDQP